MGIVSNRHSTFLDIRVHLETLFKFKLCYFVSTFVQSCYMTMTGHKRSGIASSIWVLFIWRLLIKGFVTFCFCFRTTLGWFVTCMFEINAHKFMILIERIASIDPKKFFFEFIEDILMDSKILLWWVTWTRISIGIFLLVEIFSFAPSSLKVLLLSFASLRIKWPFFLIQMKWVKGDSIVAHVSGENFFNDKFNHYRFDNHFII